MPAQRTTSPALGAELQGRLAALATIGAMALAVIVAPARAMTIGVPAQNADLQDAVNKLAASPDADNFLYITQSPFHWNAKLTFMNNQFTPAHRLLIAPEPNMAALPRAQIVNSDPSNPLLFLANVGGIVFRDLDLLRNNTNLTELVDLGVTTDVTIERCHIGYVNASVGDPTKNMIEIMYPTHLTIRNSMLFSIMPGAFAEAIHANQFGDPQNSLYLYNDDVSDYGSVGIRIDGTGPPGSLLVMRNTIAFNSPALGTEPVAYSSGTSTNLMVIRSSDNTAFASVGHVESFDPGAVDVAASSLPDFLQLPPTSTEENADVLTRTWDLTPGALNHDFYHLVETAGLHAPMSRYGVTVTDGSPSPYDEAVLNDIDDQLRPSLGSDPHTDRGADQVDAETASAASVPRALPLTLWVAPLRNPATAIALAWHSAAAGTLVAELFDLTGRRLARNQRAVGAGSAGVLELPVPRAAGLLLYRVTRMGTSGAIDRATGRLAIVH